MKKLFFLIFLTFLAGQIIHCASDSAPVNRPPTVQIKVVSGSSQNIALNTTTNLEADASDPEGEKDFSYYWDLPDPSCGSLSSSDEKSTTFTGKKVGTCSVRVTVKDPQGADGSNTIPITISDADTTPPVVADINPVGTTNVPTGSSFLITFDDSLNCSTVTSLSVQLKQGTNIIDANPTCDGKTITLTPTNVLSGNTSYTLILTTSIKNVAGLALAEEYSRSFTTGAADIIPPQVISTVPDDTATGIAATVAISATFSEAMLVSTINNATFLLKKGSTPITGTVSYSDKTATFTPAAALDFGGVYTATITTGVQDLSKNALVSDKTWTFTIIIEGQVSDPAFDPVANTYYTATAVTISAVPVNASIRYTTNGTTPSETVGILYSQSIQLPEGSTTIKAIAYKTGYTTSNVSTGDYIVHSVSKYGAAKFGVSKFQ